MTTRIIGHHSWWQTEKHWQTRHTHPQTDIPTDRYTHTHTVTCSHPHTDPPTPTHPNIVSWSVVHSTPYRQNSDLPWRPESQGPSGLAKCSHQYLGPTWRCGSLTLCMCVYVRVEKRTKTTQKCKVFLDRKLTQKKKEDHRTKIWNCCLMFFFVFVFFFEGWRIVEKCLDFLSRARPPEQRSWKLNKTNLTTIICNLFFNLEIKINWFESTCRCWTRRRSEHDS